MCLTVEFELEEQQRSSGEAAFASFLSGVLGFCGIGHLMWRTAGPSHDSRKETEFVTIARYETSEDAEADVNVLVNSETLDRLAGKPASHSATNVVESAGVAFDAIGALLELLFAFASHV